MKTSAPLTKTQYGIYVECVQHLGEYRYNITYLYTLDGSLDEEKLKASIESVVAAHPTLFTRIELNEQGEPVQSIDDTETFSLEVEHITDIEEEKKGMVLPFDIYNDRLFRMRLLKDSKHFYLLVDIHHIIGDGTTLKVILNDIDAAYGGNVLEKEGKTLADVVREETEMRETPAFEESKQWYAQNFDCSDTFSQLIPDLEGTEKEIGLLRRKMSVSLEAIDAFCKKHGIFKSTFFTGVYSYLLAKYNNDQEALFSTVYSGRTDKQLARTVAMLVKTVPVYAKFTNDTTVLDFLKAGEEQMKGCREHETYSYMEVVSDLKLQIGSFFAWHGMVWDNVEINGKPTKAEKIDHTTLEVPLYANAAIIDGHCYVNAEYETDVYSEQLIGQFLESYEAVVEGFLNEEYLRNISIATKSQVELLDSFNHNDVPYDDTQTIVSLFCQQAKATPDNIAVVFKDKKYTYQEVDEISDRIAAYIVAKGLENEDVVSVLIPRCEWMAIASLGVLKAGCAYQPLDPSYPKERLNFMMQDASAKLLIADEELRDIVDEYKGDVLLTKDIEQLPALTEESRSQLSIINCQLKPEGLFIMLYTSGSTGVPKGCQLEHGNLVCFCHWYQRYYELTADSHVAAYASYGFDACMMDMYPALTCGATVYIIGEDIRLNLPDLNDYYNANNITHSFITTQVGYQFATNVDNHSLKHLSVGGEKLSAIQPPKNYNLHNGYGPTECTIFTTTYLVKDYEQDIPIGKPLDNMRLYIVDKQFNRLPLGATGELWVSGPQVSRGYLNRPDKTAEVYIANPFSDDEKYSRVYRSGDIVRYLPDGNIQFVGRRDGQVKIRGFRIEMKEVEAVIREYPGIKDVTVQAFDYDNGGKFIAAYIVSDEQVDIKELNAFIGKQKPPYMIPAATMQIDSIPLNQNQKVNKKALPAPVIQAADHEYVEPANDTEKLFCGIFSEVLSVDKIGATDNFFELGGTSLMVTKVIIEADKAGHHVAYGEVFTHPTPRLLAQLVTGETPVENTDDEVTNFDYSGINAILQQNRVETFVKGERQQLGNVLLTGATGYLGIHVLRELIDSDAPTITCLVREQDQEGAERRLKNLLFYYFETSFKELFGTRLFVVNGDVTQDLNEIVNCQLSTVNSIDTVFNCAANVKHFSKTTDIEDVNIGGAKRCVEFCVKTGAKLIHISTTSVGEVWVIRNNGEEVPTLDERKFWFGQFLDNRYIHSKFLAERIVLDAVAHHGLNAKVMRVGNLAPRSYDGEFQANFNSNSYMGRLKVFNTLGCCSYDDYDELTEMSPIVETAKAVVLLATTPKGCTVFQPFNNHTELFGDVLQLLSKVGKEIRFVERDEFEKALAEAGQDPEKAKLLSAMLAYQDMAHGQKAVFIERDNRYTCAVLHRLGFHWSDTAWDYVERMLTAISGFGYFETK